MLIIDYNIIRLYELKRMLDVLPNVNDVLGQTWE